MWTKGEEFAGLENQVEGYHEKATMEAHLILPEHVASEGNGRSISYYLHVCFPIINPNMILLGCLFSFFFESFLHLNIELNGLDCSADMSACTGLQVVQRTIYLKNIATSKSVL